MRTLILLLFTFSLHSLNAQVYDTLVWADEFNGTRKFGSSYLSWVPQPLVAVGD